MTGTIRVGMSGFSYPEWIGEIYPVGTKRNAMLSAYADIFPTVEINMTFRRLPKPEAADKWRDAVPESFTFAMKAWQLITHFRRLVGAERNVQEFMDIANRLRDRLGPVLFQIRKDMKFDQALIDTFATSLPKHLWAFEPRNDTFMETEALDTLARNNLALCLNDDLFDPANYRVTGPFAYFRFHRDFYAPENLDLRASIVKRIASEGTDVYVYFAHEDNPESVKPALRFLELVS